MADEYKALTYINLPFLDENGRLYLPGQMIPHDAFEESVTRATEAINNPETEINSAEGIIAEMIEFGSLSEDPDADLHPDHQPVEPGSPTVAGMIEEAKALVAQLEERGSEVPPELRALADSQLVAASDNGSGGEAVA
jgi:hypothetical protein